MNGKKIFSRFSHNYNTVEKYIICFFYTTYTLTLFASTIEEKSQVDVSMLFLTSITVYICQGSDTPKVLCVLYNTHNTFHMYCKYCTILIVLFIQIAKFLQYTQYFNLRNVFNVIKKNSCILLNF